MRLRLTIHHTRGFPKSYIVGSQEIALKWEGHADETEEIGKTGAVAFETTGNDVSATFNKSFDIDHMHLEDNLSLEIRCVGLASQKIQDVLVLTPMMLDDGASYKEHKTGKGTIVLSYKKSDPKAVHVVVAAPSAPPLSETASNEDVIFSIYPAQTPSPPPLAMRGGGLGVCAG